MKLLPFFFDLSPSHYIRKTITKKRKGEVFMNEFIISLDGISKKFNSIIALDDMTFKIPSGITGLIGPNGAGKTTILRVLLGLIRPDSGFAKVLGFDTKYESLAIRERIGVLHDRIMYTPFLTPLEYLDTMSRLYPKPKNPRDLLKQVGLSGAANRRIKTLSAGMHQRLGIAQSLMSDPELVLLDEPTTNLDVSGRDQILQLIQDIHRETGTSFLISSHILSELERVCHYLVFIDNGHVVESGTLLDIIKRHSTNRFRILASDSKKLYDILYLQAEFKDLLVAGSNIIMITADMELKDVVRDIGAIAQSVGVEVYEISRSTNLEDVFRGVVKK
ncbi:MAG: ATP-binding cassette domain-containing protein [Candidatus Lokiarchaeota archaeon]|nr:ATP-binding cassette domain-containing protein [Candidatus Lokiarchaeota archaeon]